MISCISMFRSANLRRISLPFSLPISWPWWGVGLGFGLLASIAAATPASCASGDVIVVVDQAKLMKLPDRAATLVIGNPLIADASLQPGGLMVLTGKGYGTTNFIALDQNGKVLMQRRVRVEGPKEAVSVYRGTERESYSCTPNCAPQIMLGDSSAAFTATMGQTTARNSTAQGASH